VLDVQHNPANDLTLFGGYEGISHEYQDTLLFLYSNAATSNDLNDISRITSTLTNVGPIFKNFWVWGQESATNYVDYDDKNGYNNLSYLNDKAVRGPNIEYAIHFRAYDPIPKFTSGLRFIGKNFTDFGRLSFTELGTEISSLAGYIPITDSNASALIADLNEGTPNYGPYSTITNNNNQIRFKNNNRFSVNYADALIDFDALFSTSVLFGKQVGQTGLAYTFTGYKDCIDKYAQFYSTTQGLLTTYTVVLSTASAQLTEYITTYYGQILPPSILTRNRVTDPLPFQFLLSSFLVPPYDTQYDQWGLGYNLGFNKIDTPPTVSLTSNTFIRIVDDYIYLQLNPEYNMNSMSVSGKEDKAMCLDSSAQESKYFSKILLNDFGGYCRTAVQMPKTFNPVLGKYESLSCRLVDRSGQPINNVDCEYDFVLEVTEILSGPEDTASLLPPTADLSVFANNFLS